jgi:hypothetical protein
LQRKAALLTYRLHVCEKQVPVVEMIADIDRNLIFESLGRQPKSKIPLIMSFLQAAKAYIGARPVAQRSEPLDIQAILRPQLEESCQRAVLAWAKFTRVEPKRPVPTEDRSLSVQDFQKIRVVALASTTAPPYSHQRVQSAASRLQARLAASLERAVASGGGGAAMRAAAVESAFKVLGDIHAALHTALPAYSLVPEDESGGSGARALVREDSEDGEAQALAQLAGTARAQLAAAWDTFLEDSDERVRKVLLQPASGLITRPGRRLPAQARRPTLATARPPRPRARRATPRTSSDRAV